MGVSKVDYGGETLIDLSGDSVTPQTMLAGATAHNAAGDQIEGAVVVTEVSRVVVTLAADGWDEGSDYAYTQTVAVSGLTAETDFDWDAELTGTDEESDLAVLAALACVAYAGGADGAAVFKASALPEVNLPMIIRLYS